MKKPSDSTCEDDSHLKKSIPDIMQKAKAGRCIIPLNQEIPESWILALGNNYSVRYVYQIPRAMVVSRPISADFPLSIRPLTDGECDLFLMHFKRICDRLPHELATELLQSTERFPAVWTRLPFKLGYYKNDGDNTLVASLLVTEVTSYPELEIERCRVVAWCGYEPSQMSLAVSSEIKIRWMKNIHELVTDAETFVGLIHHRNKTSRRFAEKLGTQIVGASIRWEGQ